MPKVYLTRRARFSASHRLHSSQLTREENQKLFGKCNSENGHGHNYVLQVSVYGELDPQTGIVMNLTDLKAAIERCVLAKVDHKNLNLDVPEFKELNPTAENIAIVCWNWLAKEIPPPLLFEICLHETENNVVRYRGE